MESNSFGAGHAGVAYDVELMQQGWLEAKGEDSAIFDQVRLSGSKEHLGI